MAMTVGDVAFFAAIVIISAAVIIKIIKNKKNVSKN